MIARGQRLGPPTARSSVTAQRLEIHLDGCRFVDLPTARLLTSDALPGSNPSALPSVDVKLGDVP
jgi:hypothetical protein